MYWIDLDGTQLTMLKGAVRHEIENLEEQERQYAERGAPGGGDIPGYIEVFKDILTVLEEAML